MVYCASPEYLRRHGTPKKPQDLAKHSLIASLAGSTKAAWRFGGRALKLAPRLTVTTNDAAIEAVLGGAGITRLFSYQVARHVEKGELATVLERHESAPQPIHVVHREGRHASAKVRAFVDLIVARLRADPAVNRR
jgi:DNA-binding transcriptional LysR family regulator